MLTLLVGTPGSGKTVYAIDQLLKISKHELKAFKNIQRVYTNISGFKFEKFEKTGIKFKLFDFNVFFKHLQVLHVLYLQNVFHKFLDELLIEYCKEHRLFDSYFVIDECHNFFADLDKSKMWWLTYHRHLHHEILFLTQNKNLINIKYRNIPEIYIEAQPRSKAISKNQMRYFFYTDFTMKNKYQVESISVIDKHFEIYKSGNVSSQKLVGMKYIYGFGFFLFTLFFLGYMFYLNFFVNSHKKNDISPKKDGAAVMTYKPTNSVSIKVNSIDSSIIDYKYMLLNCNKIQKICMYKNAKINYGFYLNAKDLFNIEEVAITKKFDEYYELEILVPKQFYLIYNKEFSNEKNNINSSANYANGVRKQ